MAVSVGELMVMAKFFADLSVDAELDPTSQEAFARAAASKAYYACYHRALDWAKHRGYTRPPDGWGVHEALWLSYFAHEPETDDIRQAGDALRAKRVQADYYINKPFRHRASEIIDEADELLELIDADVQRVSTLPSHKTTWNRATCSRRRQTRQSPKKPAVKA